MRTAPLPPLATVLSFVDCINRGDLDGLERLMTDDHTLQVLDEAPLQGRTVNVQAWRGYMTSFPQNVMYPHRLSEEKVAAWGIVPDTPEHRGGPTA